ncbi:hypothetical protein MYA98_05445 [Salmonella sp. WGH-01]|nr:hypothetical protein MYA98_05445 [Salmonella sp. WGH-01]
MDNYGFSFSFSNVYAEDCSQQDFDKADMALDSLASWKAVDGFIPDIVNVMWATSGKARQKNYQIVSG